MALPIRAVGGARQRHQHAFVVSVAQCLHLHALFPPEADRKTSGDHGVLHSFLDDTVRDNESKEGGCLRGNYSVSLLFILQSLLLPTDICALTSFAAVQAVFVGGSGLCSAQPQ